VNDEPEGRTVHRKRRTKEHVIAGLGVNFVERCALLAGYSVESIEHDYGVDLLLFTYNEAGEIENGSVSLQVKASDNLTVLADQETVSFPIARADLDHWLQELYPCILIVYDAQADEAFWLYVQAYFKGQSDFDIGRIGETIQVRLSKANRVTPAAMRRFAEFKARVLQQAEKAEIEYGD